MRSALGRRDFLRSVVAVVGPTTVVAGCADDVQPKHPPSPEFFPQSVASGDPRPASVVLWTRVEDADADAARALEVQLEVALDEDFSELVELTPGSPMLSLAADGNDDHCVKVRLENLEASTT